MNLIRKILFPFSGIYYVITLTRNFLFNRDLFKHKAYDFPVIGIGNLSTGGTGKTPMTEYVVRQLKNKRVATLSRGYGRKTTGFKLVTTQDKAIDVGDEPLQIKCKFPNITVAVDANRQAGIAQLMGLPNALDCIVLDDVYQHRKVKPGFLILLTTYSDLFYNDFVLPVGNLREPRQGARRADCVVVTKCPEHFLEIEMQDIKKDILKYTSAPVYFSGLHYEDGVVGEEEILVKELPQEFTLVTGIARPEPLVLYLKKQGLSFKHLKYSDHHNFTQTELENLEKEKFILTTEKDFARLKGVLLKPKLYYLPIRVKFIPDAALFNRSLQDYVSRYED